MTDDFQCPTKCPDTVVCLTTGFCPVRKSSVGEGGNSGRVVRASDGSIWMVGVPVTDRALASHLAQLEEEDDSVAVAAANLMSAISRATTPVVPAPRHAGPARVPTRA